MEYAKTPGGRRSPFAPPETAYRLQIRREDVVIGLLEAVEIAREKGDARAMVMAAAELNKMLGYYPSEGRGGATGGRRRLETLSEEELLAAIPRYGEVLAHDDRATAEDIR